ncbi:MAG TPA: 50S ribosomal protein L3 N(5)-glutamine methyltransferase, partial [Aeromonadales bacterium]|nr:50S ribosomal protein L3 N(5)-glutamine methyltransferase [Aeromonadales bacterium]
KRRIDNREPLPYITGVAYFCGLPFVVDERVLIPRSPIAELIEQGFSPWIKDEPQRILDLCTGSGCIAIACGYAFPEAELVATDLSEQALEVAEINRIKHHQQNRLSLVQGNLFDALKTCGNTVNQQFDIIVTNPPYVDAEDMADLPTEFLLEPELALAAGDDGLELVHTILQQAADFLTTEGLLVVEVGNSAAALEQSYPEVPFTWIEFAHGGDGVFVLTRSQLMTHFAL